MRSSSRWVALAVVAALGSSVARADEPTPPPPATEAPPPVAEPPTPAVAPAPAPAPASVVAPAPAANDKDDIPRPSKGLTFGLAGGAAACLVSGIILGAVAKARSNEQDGDPSNPPLYTPELQDRGKQGNQLATAAYVMLALGGAMGIADVVLFVERYRPHRKKAQASAVSVKPGLFSVAVTF